MPESPDAAMSERNRYESPAETPEQLAARVILQVPDHRLANAVLALSEQLAELKSDFASMSALRIGMQRERDEAIEQLAEARKREDVLLGIAKRNADRWFLDEFNSGVRCWSRFTEDYEIDITVPSETLTPDELAVLAALTEDTEDPA